MKRGRPGRGVGAVGIVALLFGWGCGSRTALLQTLDDAVADAGDDDASGDGDVTPDDGPPGDDGGPEDAGRRDGGRRRDAGPRDGSASDASSDDGGDAGDGGPIDAAPDAPPPITCTATTTTVLAQTGFELDQVAVDDTGVYFHDTSAIWHVAKNGGPVQKIAPVKSSGWPYLQEFVMDDSTLTWLEIVNGKSSTLVKRAPKAGGATVTLATLSDYIYLSAPGAAPGEIYAWTNTPSLQSVQADGTVGTVMNQLPNLTSSVLVDGTDLYILSGGALQRWDGSTFTLIATVEAYTGYLRLDAATSTFYFLESDGQPKLASVPKAGGTPTVLFTPASGWIGDYAFDDTSLYAIDRLTPSITRMNKDGTGATTLGPYTSLQQILDIQMDAQCIYFTAILPGAAAPEVIAEPR